MCDLTKNPPSSSPLCNNYYSHLLCLEVILIFKPFSTLYLFLAWKMNVLNDKPQVIGWGFCLLKAFFPFKEYGFLLALINEEQTSLYFTSQGSHIIRILQFETFFSNNFQLSQSNGKTHVFKRYLTFLKYLAKRLREWTLSLEITD